MLNKSDKLEVELKVVYYLMFMVIGFAIGMIVKGVLG